jgi:hypothetical protein
MHGMQDLTRANIRRFFDPSTHRAHTPASVRVADRDVCVVEVFDVPAAQAGQSGIHSRHALISHTAW